MYSIAILALYLLIFPKLRADPDGILARVLRLGLPIVLVVIGGWALSEKLKYGEVKMLTELNPLTLLGLMQAYAALWFVHAATSVNWILSSRNQAAWLRLPWQKGSAKLTGFLRNGLICFPLMPLLFFHILVVAAVLIAYVKRKKRVAR